MRSFEKKSSLLNARIKPDSAGKKKLSKTPESVEFIEIPRVKADHKTKENKRPDLIVRKGQFAVEISPGFDPASLETVLKVIGGL